MRPPDKKRHGRAAFSIALAVLLACSMGFSSIAWAAKEDGSMLAAANLAPAADAPAGNAAGGDGAAGDPAGSSAEKPEPASGPSEAEGDNQDTAPGTSEGLPGGFASDGSEDAGASDEHGEGTGLSGLEGDDDGALDDDEASEADEGELSLLSLEEAEDAEEDVQALSAAVHKNDVPYASGVCADAVVVEPSTIAWDGADGTSWYTAEGTVNMTGRIVVSGSISLILEDGCSLIASSGITVNSGSTLTVYAQSGGSGSLNATASGSAAGIGSAAGASGGNIVINGGSITATGGTGGAGIGGGNGGSCGSVAINGGRITARGGSSGAGIGGGHNGGGGSVSIRGGSVTATGGASGAGIGGGSGGPGGTTTITGGSIAANGGSSAAGIGGGSGAGGGTVDISGGTTTAYGGTGIGIGAGEGGSGGTFTSRGNAFVACDTVKAESNNLGGIVIVNDVGEVYGNTTLQADVMIPQGVKLTIPENTTLTIPSGVSIENEGTLVNNGRLENNGSFTNSRQFNNNGSFVNNGSFTNKGTLQGSGSISGSGSFSGKRGVQSPPPTPTLKTVTDSSIAVEPIAQAGVGALEYACAQGMRDPSNWQTSPVFNGLNKKTNYRIYARFAGNSYFDAAQSAEALRVTTLEDAVDPGPDEPDPDKPDPVTPGTVTDATDSANNYLRATLLGGGMQLAEKVLSAADLKRVQDGTSVSIFLEASDAVTEGDKALVEDRVDVTSGFAVASYIDLTLWQRFDGETAPVPISTCVKPVGINVQVPAGLPPLSADASRLFTVMCVHGGSVSTLPATLDAANGGVRFEASEFSAYALVYRDVAGGAGGGASGDDSGSADGNGSGVGDGNGGADGNGTGVGDGNGGDAGGWASNGTFAEFGTPPTPSANELGEVGSLAKTGDAFGVMTAWALLAAGVAFGFVAAARSRRRACAEGVWAFGPGKATRKGTRGSTQWGTTRGEAWDDGFLGFGPQAQAILEIGRHSTDSIQENIERFARKNARCARKMEKRGRK